MLTVTMKNDWVGLMKNLLRFGSFCALFCFLQLPCLSQVRESAYRNSPLLSAGAELSYFYVGYGQRQLGGPTVFFDIGPKARLSVEGQARWLNLGERANVSDSTYLIGPRVRVAGSSNFTYYAKVLVGRGNFNFPYNYAHGSYLVISPGAEADYRLSKRLTWRIADVEYQYWNQFTYGSLPSYGVSSGLRYSF